MSATIKDVARTSGISPATVSKFLNGRQVRPNSETKIKEAIRVLNYHANPSARSLRTARSMVIGVLVDNIVNVFYSGIISLAAQQLQERNYSSIICETNESPALFEKQLEFLLSRKVDGIMILSNNVPTQILTAFSERFSNIVVVDSAFHGVNCDFVLTDNQMAAYHATERFIIMGHENIAIITGEDKYFTARERLKGYERVHDDYHLPVIPENVFRDAYDIEGGYRAFKKLASGLSGQGGPTAVLVTSYFMTVGSIIAINEEGIRVPDDISLICFDNYELNKVFSPKLTCVVQPSEEISRKAVEFLLDRINGENSESRIFRLPPIIITGASVKGCEPEKVLAKP